MPYIIKKIKEGKKTGYKVCKRDEPKKCFSEHVMTEKKAKKQRTAIILSELGLSKKRKGGSEGGSDKKPSTIPEIQSYLHENGHSDKVFELIRKKGKKSDWVTLLNSVMNEIEHVPMIPAETVERISHGDLNIAKDASEAFQRLGLIDKEMKSSKKSSTSKKSKE